MQVHRIRNIGAPHGGLGQVRWWVTLTYFLRSQTHRPTDLKDFTLILNTVLAITCNNFDAGSPNSHHTVLTITCHNLDAGSPNSHHRWTTWRPRSSSMISDLDLLSMVTGSKDFTLILNTVLAITCHNFDAGSPNSHHRCTTWRPRPSLMMSDLDLLSKVADRKDCKTVYLQKLAISLMQVHQIDYTMVYL